jgi:hypothetical protein
MRIFSSWYKYIIITVVVLAVVGGGFLYFNQKKSSVITPGESLAPTPTPTVELTTWNDPAGFSFQYPKDLTVDKNEEDDDNYAHVEFTNPNHPGSIIVWASDPPRVWPPKEGISIDTTLGGEAAKKIMISTPSAKLIVGTIFDGLLFKIEGTYSDKQFWQPIQDTIIASFAFIQEASAVSGEASGDAVDEQEVLQ